MTFHLGIPQQLLSDGLLKLLELDLAYGLKIIRRLPSRRNIMRSKCPESLHQANFVIWCFAWFIGREKPTDCGIAIYEGERGEGKRA